MAQRIKYVSSSLHSQTYMELGLPNEDNELEEKLARILSTISEGSLLSIPTMKNYITFAKANVFPELNDEAFQTLGAYFSELSEAYKDSSSKTTVRNLETLVRMGQARAKVELRSEVTKRDIQEIICIFNESYFGSDEGKPNSAQGLSKQKQTTLFIEKLRMQAEVNGSKIFSMSDLVNIATQIKLNVGEFSTFIDKLNNASLLLFKGDNKYELV
jgi:DNA helicase MCM8